MPSSQNKKLVLVAMIFAVSMMFIDQTIVVLAIPDLSKELSLSATGAQWIVNGYLLALSALFAFGGRLADVLGHRRMVTIGVAGFALFSALCGATPTGALAEPWLITFRVLQGASAAVLFTRRRSRSSSRRSTSVSAARRSRRSSASAAA